MSLITIFHPQLISKLCSLFALLAPDGHSLCPPALQCENPTRDTQLDNKLAAGVVQTGGITQDYLGLMLDGLMYPGRSGLSDLVK